MKLNKVLILILLFCGCNYYSIKNTVPAHLNTVFITPIINETSEFGLSETLTNNFLDYLNEENVMNVTSYFEKADNKIDIKIINILDEPDVISVTDAGYEYIKQWKLVIQTEIIWFDLIQQKEILNKIVNEFVLYNYNQDIGVDDIDNDQDGLVDSQDPDESTGGSPRNALLNIGIDLTSKRIIEELTSIW